MVLAATAHSADRARHADALVDRARGLVPALKERAARAVADRRVPDETIDDIQRLELARCLQPVMFGGYGSDYRVFSRIIRILAQGCGSTAWVCGVFGEHSWLIGMFPEEAQREVWTENPRALTAASFAPTGTAVPVPGGFRLAGRWSFASGCDHCQWLLLGGHVTRAGQPPEERVFLVPVSAAVVVDDWHALGLVGTGSKSVVVADAFVPVVRTLTPYEMKAGTAPGAALHRGFPLYGAPRSLFSVFSLSSVVVGLAERAVTDFVAHTRERMSRGTRMAELESVQLTMAGASARAETAVLVVESTCARNVAMLAAGEEITTEHVAWTRRNSAYAAQLAHDAVSALFHASGASAIYRDHPLQATFRDATAGVAHHALTWDRSARPYGQSRLGIPIDFDVL
jgi:alkylation response protein AidB-like acyl-CoA dehydrogenase